MSEPLPQDLEQLRGVLPDWALEEESRLTRRNPGDIARALDTARRQGFGEGIKAVAEWLAPNFPGQARDLVRDYEKYKIGEELPDAR